MTALETLREELAKIQRAENECVNEFGIVKPGCRYRYQILIQQAKDLKSSINWLSKVYEEQAGLVLPHCAGENTEAN